jgi:uncharacterized protein
MADWDKLTGIGDVVDKRGIGGGSLLAGGSGIIAILIVIGLNFLGLNISPSTVENVLSVITENQAATAPESTQAPEFRGADTYEVFAGKVLGSTDEVWTKIFQDNNQNYKKPRLVLFRNSVSSGCGIATTQTGPHYCPADNTIYLDERFFDELHSKLGGDKGDVAQAYVIAHEVGHHVQNLDGSLAGGQQDQVSAIQLELQADCYAGIWAYSIKNLGVFENDQEINEALSAASAVGDDNIQQTTEGRIRPENWTHGSSEQRVNAFKKGYTTGKPAQCVNL